MKKELIVKLHGEFEQHAHAENDVEFWFARDLQNLLGYERWENFFKVVEKAKIACQNSKQVSGNHFRDVTKMVTIGSGAPRDIGDIALSQTLHKSM